MPYLNILEISITYRAPSMGNLWDVRHFFDWMLILLHTMVNVCVESKEGQGYS